MVQRTLKSEAVESYAYLMTVQSRNEKIPCGLVGHLLPFQDKPFSCFLKGTKKKDPEPCQGPLLAQWLAQSLGSRPGSRSPSQSSASSAHLSEVAIPECPQRLRSIPFKDATRLIIVWTNCSALLRFSGLSEGTTWVAVCCG